MSAETKMRGRRLAVALAVASAGLAGAARAGVAVVPQPAATPALASRSVTGVVFDDVNGNGRRDSGEAGVAGARVSDQSTIVATATDGAYRLTAAAGAELVFVSLPEGWVPVGAFWKSIAAAESQADFPLRRREPRGEWSFVHASDTHVSRQSLPRLQRLRERVEALRPDFVLLTGDLVKDALRVSEAEAAFYYKLLGEELARFPVPVFSVPGNHEIFGIERHLSLVSQQHPLYGKRMYRQRLGPNYYSFDWGGVRFVGLDTVDVDDLWYYGHLDAAQLAWLESDLGSLAAGAPVVTFNHIPLASAVEGLHGYVDEPPAPSLIRVGNRTQYRHVVSNTGELLAKIAPRRLEIALGGHMHLRETLAYETAIGRVRFHQTGAVVGPVELAGLTLPSGFTVYRVRDGRVDDGAFVALDEPGTAGARP